jgi:VWFA-related protein
MSPRACAAWLSVGLLGLGGWVRAQEALPAVEAGVVRLDAVVTNAESQLVRSLTRDDFVLLEDGKAQRISHFLFVSKTAAVLQGQQSNQSGASEPAASDTGRQIAVVVDDLHIAPGNLQYTREALKRFLDELTVPDDSLALVTTSSSGGLQGFSQDRQAFRQAIDQLNVRDTTVGPARGSEMTAVQAELVLRGDRSALRLATHLVLDDPGSLLQSDGPRAAIAATQGYTPAGLEPREAAAASEAQRQARGILSESLHFSSITLNRLADVVRGLASMPGRKICLLVSDGFLVGAGTTEELTRELRTIADAATRSGAVVYALDARGLITSISDAGVAGGGVPPALQQGVTKESEKVFRSTLQAVSGDTGGFLVQGTNDLARGLQRMLEDNTAYYLIAYESSNAKRDGKFRKIEVRLARHSDYVVRTRKGYFAPDDRRKPSRAAGGALSPLGEAEARAVLATPLPRNGLPVRLSANYLDLPPLGSQAILQAHLDVSGLAWEKVSGRRRALLELVGGVYDASGNPIGTPFEASRVLDLTSAEYEQVRKAGLGFERGVALSPGRYQIRLFAVRPQSGPQVTPLGGASQWVEVPDLSQKQLAMSAVFLSTSAQPPTAGVSNTGGVEAVEAARTARRFKRSAGLYFQFYVYNPTRDESGAHDVVVQAQIWSGANVLAASKPLPAEFRDQDGVPLPEANGMSLESLEPGRYELRVVVVDNKGKATVRQGVEFTVE